MLPFSRMSDVAFEIVETRYFWPLVMTGENGISRISIRLENMFKVVNSHKNALSRKQDISIFVPSCPVMLNC